MVESAEFTLDNSDARYTRYYRRVMHAYDCK